MAPCPQSILQQPPVLTVPLEGEQRHARFQASVPEAVSHAHLCATLEGHTGDGPGVDVCPAPSRCPAPKVGWLLPAILRLHFPNLHGLGSAFPGVVADILRFQGWRLLPGRAGRGAPGTQQLQNLPRSGWLLHYLAPLLLEHCVLLLSSSGWISEKEICRWLCLPEGLFPPRGIHLC